jgi:hypothetical protein
MSFWRQELIKLLKKTQPINNNLTQLGGLAKADGNIIVGDGTNWTVESGATARASLGLTIGTQVQAYSANLTAWSALATNTKQDASANLTTLSGIASPLAAGLRDFLDVPVYVADYAALKALDTAKDTVAVVTDLLRNGIFKWDGTDNSSVLVNRVLTSFTVSSINDTIDLRFATTSSVNDVTNTLNFAAAHGFVNGDRVYVAAAVNGFVLNVAYRVVNATSLTLQLSHSTGGAAIDFTGTTDMTLRFHHNLRTGDAITFNETANGFTANTLYYVIYNNDRSMKFATTRELALAGTARDITADTAMTINVLNDPYEGVHVIRTGLSKTGSQGVWRRLRDDFGVVTTWFGVKGDGVTIDTGPLQAAIVAAERWGGLVKWPSGLCLIDDKLIVNAPIRLEGEVASAQFFTHGEQSGWVVSGNNFAGSWIRLASGAALARGWTDPLQHGLIEFTFNNLLYGGGYVDQRRWCGAKHIGVNGHGGGQDASTAYSCFLIRNAWHVNVERCIGLNPRNGDGIAATVDAQYNSLNNAMINYNYFYGNNTGLGSRYGIYWLAGDSQCHGNHCTGWARGIHVAAGGVSINGNKLEGNNEYGAFFSSAVTMWTFVGNMVYANLWNGVLVSGVDNANNDDDSRGTITGNGIFGNGLDTAASLQRRSGVSILGNSKGLVVGCNNIGNFIPLPTSQTYGVYGSAANADVVCVGNGYFNNINGEEFWATGAIVRDGAGHISSTGSPEGRIAAPVGSRFTARDGAAGTTLWIKETGTGNTGWVAAATGITGTAVYDPPSLADGAGVTTTVTVTGAVLGDLVDVSFSLNLQGITMTGYVSAADTVSVRFQNETGGVIDLGSGTIKARARK